jgi:DNA-binding NtrC family response regulator
MDRSPEPELTPELLVLLQTYPWPGNIRELRNVIERAVLLCTGTRLEQAHLPVEKMSSHFAMRRLDNGAIAPPSVPPVAPPAPPGPAELREQLAVAEKQRIVDALSRCAGNQTEAALSLGISRRTLVKRLSEFNIPRPRKRLGKET